MPPFTLRWSAPEDAGGIHADLVQDRTNRLVGVEVEVHGPLAVSIAEVESPGPVPFVANLGNSGL